MIYQACLCIGQTIITLTMCNIMKVNFPRQSLITPWPILDIGISLFLITYCADMMSLMVSAFVRNTTTAMTIMPFLLIFQLVFSGAFFQLDGISTKITNFTVAKWGLTALCSQGDYNSLPMVTLWNAVAKFQDVDAGDYLINFSDELNDNLDEGEKVDFTSAKGYKPIQGFMQYAQESGSREEILKWSGENNQNEVYAFEPSTVLRCWGFLLLFIAIYASLAVLSLEFIDHDKR